MLGGTFGKYLLPGIVAQSVLIGGGYATGREVVQYAAKFGAMGWIGVLGVFIGFTTMNIAVFELARTYQTYDYRSLIKQVIWKFWPAFDISYIVLATIIIAIMASATGNIVEQTIGIPYMAGVLAVLVIVGVLHFYGRSLIEKFKTGGTIALYIGYIIFGVIVLSQTWGNVTEVWATGSTAYVGEISATTVLKWGILYVGYNLAVLPATFFTLRRQTKRKHTVGSGIIGGLLMTLPFLLTMLCIWGYYPSEEVLGASVPWLVMLDKAAATNAIVVIYGLVMGWTLIETSTGIIHAFVERIDFHLEETGKGGLSQIQEAGLAVGFLGIALILSRIGIIDLIAKGYTTMSYVFIAVFAIPVLTIGVIRIIKPEWKKEFWERA